MLIDPVGRFRTARGAGAGAGDGSELLTGELAPTHIVRGLHELPALLQEHYDLQS